MLVYVRGDATYPVGTGAKVICHCVNDQGKWGSGFVVALSKRWHRPEEFYRQWHRRGATSLEIPLDDRCGPRSSMFRLGSVQIVQVTNDVWVSNIIGQHQTIRTVAKPIRYDALRQGLSLTASFCQTIDASAHMPRIGADRARGEWSVIEGLIEETLILRGVPTTVYDL